MGPQPQTEFVLLYELDGVPHEHVLKGPRVVIGRAKDCDICLAFNTEVSRLHATLSATPEGWTVEDMSSRVGTSINGEPISGPRLLGDKDVLQIGQVAMTLREKKYGSETVSLGSDARSEFQAAARDAATAPGDKPADEPTQPTATPPSPEQLHLPPPNFYALVGLPDFEHDVDKIQEAAKSRLAELRSGDGAASHTEQQAQLDAIASGLAAVAHPDKKREHDLELAERLGIDVEVRGGRVVPVGQEGMGQLAVGIAIVIVLAGVLWLALPYLRAALAPLLEGPQ